MGDNINSRKRGLGQDDPNDVAEDAMQQTFATPMIKRTKMSERDWTAFGSGIKNLFSNLLSPKPRFSMIINEGATSMANYRQANNVFEHMTFNGINLKRLAIMHNLLGQQPTDNALTITQRRNYFLHKHMLNMSCLYHMLLLKHTVRFVLQSTYFDDKINSDSVAAMYEYALNAMGVLAQFLSKDAPFIPTSAPDTPVFVDCEWSAYEALLPPMMFLAHSTYWSALGITIPDMSTDVFFDWYSGEFAPHIQTSGGEWGNPMPISDSSAQGTAKYLAERDAALKYTWIYDLIKSIGVGFIRGLVIYCTNTNEPFNPWLSAAYIGLNLAYLWRVIDLSDFAKWKISTFIYLVGEIVTWKLINTVKGKQTFVVDPNLVSIILDENSRWMFAPILVLSQGAAILELFPARKKELATVPVASTKTHANNHMYTLISWGLYLLSSAVTTFPLLINYLPIAAIISTPKLETWNQTITARRDFFYYALTNTVAPEDKIPLPQHFENEQMAFVDDPDVLKPLVPFVNTFKLDQSHSEIVQASTFLQYISDTIDAMNQKNRVSTGLAIAGSINVKGSPFSGDTFFDQTQNTLVSEYHGRYGQWVKIIGYNYYNKKLYRPLLTNHAIIEEETFVKGCNWISGYIKMAHRLAAEYRSVLVKTHTDKRVEEYMEAFWKVLVGARMYRDFPKKYNLQYTEVLDTMCAVSEWNDALQQSIFRPNLDGVTLDGIITDCFPKPPTTNGLEDDGIGISALKTIVSMFEYACMRKYEYLAQAAIISVIGAGIFTTTYDLPLTVQTSFTQCAPGSSICNIYLKADISDEIGKLSQDSLNALINTNYTNTQLETLKSLFGTVDKSNKVLGVMQKVLIGDKLDKADNTTITSQFPLIDMKDADIFNAQLRSYAYQVVEATSETQLLANWMEWMHNVKVSGTEIFAADKNVSRSMLQLTRFLSVSAIGRLNTFKYTAVQTAQFMLESWSTLIENAFTLEATVFPLTSWKDVFRKYALDHSNFQIALSRLFTGPGLGIALLTQFARFINNPSRPQARQLMRSSPTATSAAVSLAYNVLILQSVFELVAANCTFVLTVYICYEAWNILTRKRTKQTVVRDGPTRGVVRQDNPLGNITAYGTLGVDDVDTDMTLRGYAIIKRVVDEVLSTNATNIVYKDEEEKNFALDTAYKLLFF